MPVAFLSPQKHEKVALEVIRVLHGRFDNFPEETNVNRNAPFHEAFLRAFETKINNKIDVPYFISLSSWLHGLNTTLGQTFFENVAHILSEGEKREFTEKRQNRLTITLSQRDTVATIISDLKNSTALPSKENEDQRLLQSNDSTEDISAQDFTADNFVETDEYIEAIELKSVRPNAGEMQGEKRKILNAKAALKRRYSTKQVSYYFGFPFDPWSNSPTGYNKDNFLGKIIEGKKYLDPNEVLLAGELWDKLSGQPNTMEKLLEVINSIATPEFLNKYEFLSNPDNVENHRDTYIQILDNWGLIREKNIVENIDVIRSRTRTRSLERALNNSIFNKGEYNSNRYDILIGFL